MRGSKLPVFLLIFASISDCRKLPQKPEKIFKFWQIGDIHYDKYYTESGEIGDWCHKVESGIAGKFGEYQCETSRDLFESALQAMKRINPDPDFIISTGDSTPHWNHPDYPDWEYIYQAESFITDKIIEYFPNTTVIPVLGNHDAYLPDNFTYNDREVYGNTSLYRSRQYIDFLERSGWTQFIPEGKARMDFEFCGYHMRHLPDLNLDVIAMNTNLYYRTSIIDLDPCEQFFWVSDQLKMAKKKNRKVIITGHVPPGFYEREYIGPYFDQIRQDEPINKGDINNQMYSYMANEHHDTIVAHIFGHTHTDTFRVLTDKYRNPTGAMLLAPSITPLVTHQYPSVGTNPGIRQYLYPNNSDSLLDYQQYFLNLEKANLLEAAQWTTLYNFSTSYNVTDLSGASLRRVLESIKVDDGLFQKAYQYNTLERDNGRPCDYDCKINFVCAMGNTQEEDMHNCLDSGGGDFPIQRKTDWLGILIYCIFTAICVAAFTTCCYKLGCFEDCCWIRRFRQGEYQQLAGDIIHHG